MTNYGLECIVVLNQWIEDNEWIMVVTGWIMKVYGCVAVYNHYSEGMGLEEQF